MDRVAAFDGRDAHSTPAHLADGPDGPGRPDTARVEDAAASSSASASLNYAPQRPSSTTPFDTLPSSSSAASSFQSFQSNGGYQHNNHYAEQQQQQQQPRPPPLYYNTTSGSDSQDTASSAPTTASSADADRPDASSKNGGYEQHAHAHAYEHDFSSQESQLLQLSTLAAARERMADTASGANGAGGPDPLETGSRKRTADGTVKHTHTRTASSASPMYGGGHSRNTSTVSVASTTGSRIGELSAELKARLSYAMVKVNNGWQSHSIDQVENLASQAGSPTSSTTSTIHGRQAASVSPRIPGLPSSHNRQLSQASLASVSTANTTMAPQWSSQQAAAPSNHSTPPLPSPLAPPPSRTGAAGAAGAAAPPPRSLAPPASIQAARPRPLARRRSNPNDTTPAAFAAAHANHASPHTPSNPVVASSGAAQQATPMGGEPMLFSPDQNVREQDAIETLLFMSSPGNSANMKHFPSFASASQPLPSGHHDAHPRAAPLPTASSNSSPQRHALPTVPRRALPHPSFYNNAQSPGGRRGGGAPGTPGHRRNPSDMSMMDMDDAYGGGAPRSAKGTPRRRANGAGYHNGAENALVSPRLKVPLSMPSGLSVPSKPRPLLAEEDIDRLLDRAAAADDDSSDSDSEILIPARPTGPVGM